MAQEALAKIHWNYQAWNEQLSLKHKGHRADTTREHAITHTHSHTHTYTHTQRYTKSQR